MIGRLKFGLRADELRHLSRHDRVTNETGANTY
jgi:hypothetical protein